MVGLCNKGCIGGMRGGGVLRNVTGASWPSMERVSHSSVHGNELPYTTEFHRRIRDAFVGVVKSISTLPHLPDASVVFERCCWEVSMGVSVSWEPPRLRPSVPGRIIPGRALCVRVHWLHPGQRGK